MDAMGAHTNDASSGGTSQGKDRARGKGGRFVKANSPLPSEMPLVASGTSPDTSMKSASHMTPPPSDSLQKDTWRRRDRILLVSMAIALGLFVALASSIQAISLAHSFRLLSLQGFMIVTGFGMVSFACSRSPTQFARVLLRTTLFGCPLVAMIIFDSPIAFWVSMATIAVATWWAYIALNGQETRVFDATLASCSGVLLFVTTGSTRILQYSMPALELAEIHFLLNARVVLLCALLAFVIVKAFWLRLTEPPPRTWRINRFEAHRSTTRTTQLAAIFDGVRVGLRHSINILLLVADILSAVLQMLVLYIVGIAHHIGRQILEFAGNMRIWNAVLRVAVCSMVAILLAALCEAISPITLEYLRTEQSFFAAGWDPWQRLLTMLALFMAGVVGTAVVGLTWDEANDVVPQAASGATTLVIVWLLVSYSMCVSERIFPQFLVGFGVLGPFTVLGSFLLILLTIGVLIASGIQKLGKKAAS